MVKLLYRGASDLYIPHETKTGDFDGDKEDESCLGYWIAAPNATDVWMMFTMQWNGFLGSGLQEGGYLSTGMLRYTTCCVS